MTMPMFQYEIARLVGVRATQLGQGAPPTVDVTGMVDALEIAEKELRMGTIPIDVIRTLPDGRKIVIKLRKKVLEKAVRTEKPKRSENAEKSETLGSLNRTLNSERRKKKVDLSDSSDSEDEAKDKKMEKKPRKAPKVKETRRPSKK